ncbi:hypothetical protein N6H14_26375 [Paenibacillus sp. CC-CFT747]|nr:hypothetical protein N6H14_26375 [Paenibacillus sp. CC-CFT747]
MPLIRGGVGQLPAWCELESFEIIRLPDGESRKLQRMGCKERIVIGWGSAVVSNGEEQVNVCRGGGLDLTADSDLFAIIGLEPDTVAVRLIGRWGEETGNSGWFAASREETIREPIGDPVDYPRQTNFDCHYHDCDEYWIFFEGRGCAVSEGVRYEVEPGDCLATGMGHHHDLPFVHEPIKAVFFETTLEGQKRRGHLWNHTHGSAEPNPERV